MGLLDSILSAAAGAQQSSRPGEAKITVPSGSFKTVRVSYRIEKPSGGETYKVFRYKTASTFLGKREISEWLGN